MAFYLDSAQPDDIRVAEQLPWCAGVTTNPTLVARAAGGGSLSLERYGDVLRSVVAATARPVFAQVGEGERAAMLRAGEQLLALAPNRLILKIPCTPVGIEVCAVLAKRGCPTAVTAVFSVAQVLLAAEAGAQWAAPYCHRYTEQAGDGLALVAGMLRALQHRGSTLRLLVASVKTRDEVERLLELGAPDLTLPLPLLAGLVTHPLTDDALARFRADVTAL